MAGRPRRPAADNKNDEVPMNHRPFPCLALAISAALPGVAAALTIETFTFASANVSLAASEGNLTCSDADGTATAAEASCDRAATSPNAGDATLTTAVSSATASAGFGRLSLGAFARGGISEGGGPRPTAGGNASAGFTDVVQSRSSTLALDEPLLVTLVFGIMDFVNLAHGSLATLEAVVEHYDHGGVDRPSRSDLMRPLGLTAQEKADLVAFMKTLDSNLSPTAVPVLPR